LRKIKGYRWIDYVQAFAKQKPFFVILRAGAERSGKKAAHVGIRYAQHTAQVKGPLSHIVFEKVLTDSTDLGLSAKPPAPTRPSSTLTISAARRHRKSLPIAATFHWRLVSTPRSKMLKNWWPIRSSWKIPVTSNSKNSGMIFVGYLRGRKAFNFELPTN
jgi:hypothetical protein